MQIYVSSAIAAEIRDGNFQSGNTASIDLVLAQSELALSLQRDAEFAGGMSELYEGASASMGFVAAGVALIPHSIAKGAAALLALGSAQAIYASVQAKEKQAKLNQAAQAAKAKAEAARIEKQKESDRKVQELKDEYDKINLGKDQTYGGAASRYDHGGSRFGGSV
jgi:hypothetical protein